MNKLYCLFLEDTSVNSAVASFGTIGGPKIGKVTDNILFEI